MRLAIRKPLNLICSLNSYSESRNLKANRPSPAKGETYTREVFSFMYVGYYGYKGGRWDFFVWRGGEKPS
jgi:hypothetical protein